MCTGYVAALYDVVLSYTDKQVFISWHLRHTGGLTSPESSQIVGFYVICLFDNLIYI